jgi:hypothetical protein
LAHFGPRFPLVAYWPNHLILISNPYLLALIPIP